MADTRTTLSTLLDISREMSSILDLDVLLEKVSQQLGRVVEHELFALLLVDEHKQQFVWKSGVGYAETARYRFQTLALNQGLAGRVYEQRIPVLISDVRNDPDYMPAETISGRIPLSALVVPLISKDRVLGVLFLESTEPDYFNPEHLQILNTLASQMAIAIENAQLYEAQYQNALIRQVLNELGKEISSILDLDELLTWIGSLTKKLIDYRVFCVGLYDSVAQEVELKVIRGMSLESRLALSRFPLAQGVMSRAIREKIPILVHDLREHPTRLPITTDNNEEPRSMVALPLIFKQRVSGVLALQHTEVGFFRQEDVEILTTFCSQLSAAIENAKLFQELYNREQKLEKDIRIARSMQLSMIPKSMPDAPGLEFAGRYIPAEDLAGDMYDFVSLDEDRLGFFIGDVSGKGVSSALVMAAARSSIRFAARVTLDPATVLYTTSRQIHRDIKNQFFVAMFYGILNTRERWFLYANGGHHPPFRISSENTVSKLQTGGTVLGMFENSRFQKERLPLVPGDIYVFYTDGVIDALDRNGQEFGDSRLLQMVIANRFLPARAIRDKIMRRLKRHTEGREPHDDITLVIMKCTQ